MASGRVDHFVQSWDVDHADLRHPRTGNADQGAVERHAGDEGMGAINRIEHPAIAAAASLFRPLLAHDAVVRKLFGDVAPEQFFGAAIRHGHRRAIQFSFDLKLPVPKVTQGKLPRFDGNLLSKLVAGKQRVQLGRHQSMSRFIVKIRGFF